LPVLFFSGRWGVFVNVLVSYGFFFTLFCYNLGIMAFLEKYISFFKGLINKLIPKEKRKIVLVCITGGLVLLIIIMALLLTGSGKESFEGPEGLNKKFAIPQGRFFYLMNRIFFRGYYWRGNSGRSGQSRMPFLFGRIR